MCNAAPLKSVLCCSKQKHCIQAPGASSTTDGAGPPAAGPLPAGLGQQMGQQWQAGEATYLAGMAQVFALLRGERNTYPGHYAAVRSVYLTYLQRPAHNKQQKVCLENCGAD